MIQYLIADTFTTLTFLFLVAVSIAYYLDYRKSKKTFKEQALGGFILLTIIVVAFLLLQYVVSIINPL